MHIWSPLLQHWDCIVYRQSDRQIWRRKRERERRMFSIRYDSGRFTQQWRMHHAWIRQRNIDKINNTAQPPPRVAKVMLIHAANKCQTTYAVPFSLVVITAYVFSLSLSLSLSFSSLHIYNWTSISRLHFIANFSDILAVSCCGHSIYERENITIHRSNLPNWIDHGVQPVHGLAIRCGGVPKEVVPGEAQCGSHPFSVSSFEKILQADLIVYFILLIYSQLCT
jgi:hypothetical protein